MPTAKINPDLEPLARPLADLHCDPRNARKHGKRDLDTIAASLALHGQQKPIVAMRDGKVIAGNGTLEAARALGWDRIACVTYDDEDAAKAAAFAIVDNRSAELSEWDLEVLSKGLRELPSSLLDKTGFVDFELEPLLAADWSPVTPTEHLATSSPGAAGHSIVFDDAQWLIVEKSLAMLPTVPSSVAEGIAVALARAL